MKKQIAVAVSLLLLLHLAKSEENLVRDSLLDFFSKLSNNKSLSGWNSTSDPCSDKWRGVTCNFLHVQKIDLRGLDLEGVFDPGTLCNDHSLSESLSIINVAGNGLRAENFAAIQNCSELTDLDLSSNQFAMQLRDSIPHLLNLQRLDVSSNRISGSLPDLSHMYGLTAFLAQENYFSGEIPELGFSRFREFNVSHNNLSGPIPVGARGLPPGSFIDNPELCGPPLSKNCSAVAAVESVPNPPPPPPPAQLKKSGLTNQQLLMYMGYVLIAFVVLFLILIWVRKKGKKSRQAEDEATAVGEDSMIKPSFSTVELKASKGDYSSAESGQMSTSLIVLTSPEVNGMRFEDLLKAPAELLGRGSHGSVYKVICEERGMTLAVKRIKDWQISSGEFRQRMRRLNQVKHPHVMPAIAYYSSGQEKLIVYEYQQHGSLFRHIHANGNQLTALGFTTVFLSVRRVKA